MKHKALFKEVDWDDLAQNLGDLTVGQGYLTWEVRSVEPLHITTKYADYIFEVTDKILSICRADDGKALVNIECSQNKIDRIIVSVLSRFEQDIEGLIAKVRKQNYNPD